MKNYDYLVIGSGVSGLLFSLEVANYGSVALVTKNKLQDSNTRYAQGGIAAVLSDSDSFEEHIRDTYTAGTELGKLPVISEIVQDGPKVIEYLISKGMKFSTDSSKSSKFFEGLSLTREGGHSHKRVVYSADATGLHLTDTLIKHCLDHQNITIYEDYTAIDLITQHHILETESFIPRITCWGAYVLDNLSSKVEIFRAGRTLLATGGAGQVYEHNTNSDVITGDGLAMAKLAGARIVNLEFIQFHPTSFYSPTGKSFLVTEALRGEGAKLVLPNGSTFMKKYHHLGSLAPRDIVAQGIDIEMKKYGYTNVYLDATIIDKSVLNRHFPNIDRKLRERGIDFSRDPIPVVPAAHYFCGGILSTIDGITDIKNLYAAGEVACTGLHGANRLASNSLLESLVVGLRAAKHAIRGDKVKFPEIPQWRSAGSFNENEWVIISHNREIIKKTMQGYVGIVRSKRLLKYALSRINSLSEEIMNFYQHNPVKKTVIETRNLVIVAGIIVKSALSRKETRGLHYIIDYPERDDDNYKKDTVIY